MIVEEFIKSVELDDDKRIEITFGPAFGNIKNIEGELLSLTEGCINENFISSEIIDNRQIVIVKQGCEKECRDKLKEEHVNAAKVAISTMNLKQGGLMF